MNPHHFLKSFILFISLIAVTPLFSKENETQAIDTVYVSKKLGIDILPEDSSNFSLYKEAAKWLGTRYKWGGTTMSTGVDCSGFTRALYLDLYDKSIDHSSRSLAKNIPVSITSPQELKPGDMVFFATSKKHKNINHVGIYLKDGFFVHASSAKRIVMVSSLLEGFYKTAWRMGGRL